MILKKSLKPKVVLTMHRDVPLLHFLWRWKVSTTSALIARFYPTAKSATAYKRLWLLERAGFIRSRSDETATYYLWTLDKRGFHFVKSNLPKMHEEGYLSENLKHDLIVTAVHLGDGLLKDIPGLEYFTEQELRRHEPKLYPSWVSDSNRHRPDGYWSYSSSLGRTVTALEVELFVKADGDYEKTGRFYDDHTEINRIVWVVEKPQFAEKIFALLKKVSRREFKHCFVILNSIYRDGWQAPILLGPESGISLRNVLFNCPTTSPQLVSCQLMLDTRKSPHKSANYRFLRS